MTSCVTVALLLCDLPCTRWDNFGGIERVPVPPLPNSKSECAAVTDARHIDRPQTGEVHIGGEIVSFATMIDQQMK